MDKEDLKAQIRKAVGSQNNLAICLNVHFSLVSNVIAGRLRSQRVEKAIAEAIETPLAEIWPQYYQ